MDLDNDWESLRYPTGRFRHRADVSMAQLQALYAWHGRHHLAHITRLRQRNGL